MKNKQFDFGKWRKRILEIKDHKTYKESLEFCDLVYEVEDIKDAKIAQTLFETFTGTPDHGVKEAVVNVLGVFDVEIYYQAYFHALPRLYRETQKTEWYYMMADYPGHDLAKDEWDIIVITAKSMPEETQYLFADIIADEEFMDDNEWAEYVLRKLKKDKK